MSIDHKLDVQEIKEVDYQNQPVQAQKRGFSNRAKYAVIVPLIALAMACNGYKTIKPDRNTVLKINKDFSSIIKKSQGPRGVKRTDKFRGPPIGDINQYDPDNYVIIETTYDPKGWFNAETSKEDSKHLIDREILKERQEPGRDELAQYTSAIHKYVIK